MCIQRKTYYIKYGTWNRTPKEIIYEMNSYGNQYRNYHIQGSTNNDFGQHFKWIIIKSANEYAEIWLLKL